MRYWICIVLCIVLFDFDWIDCGHILVRGRDSPHGVFDPWVRWDLGLDRIRSFRVVVVVVSSLRQKSSNIWLTNSLIGHKNTKLFLKKIKIRLTNSLIGHRNTILF